MKQFNTSCTIRIRIDILRRFSISVILQEGNLFSFKPINQNISAVSVSSQNTEDKSEILFLLSLQKVKSYGLSFVS